MCVFLNRTQFRIISRARRRAVLTPLTSDELSPRGRGDKQRRAEPRVDTRRLRTPTMPLKSFARRIQEKFEDAQLVPSSLVKRGDDEDGESNSNVAQYIALCEDKWRELATQAFNNTGLLNNIEALVGRLHEYCVTSRDKWRESQKEVASLSELQESIQRLSVSVGATIEEAERIERSVVGAMERKNERVLEDMRRDQHKQAQESQRLYEKNVTRLKQHHESIAHEVAQSQSSYSAVQKAADEIRAQLSNTQQQQYQNLDDVPLESWGKEQLNSWTAQAKHVKSKSEPK